MDHCSQSHSSQATDDVGKLLVELLTCYSIAAIQKHAFVNSYMSFGLSYKKMNLNTVFITIKKSVILFLYDYTDSLVCCT